MSDRYTELVVGVAPITDDQVSRLDLGPAERELLNGILLQPLDLDSGHRPRKPRRGPRVAVAAACLLGVALIAVLAVRSAGGGEEQVYASEAIAVAEANRRLLVGQEGWTIGYAEFFSPEEGEVQFEDPQGIYNGGDYLDMHWYADQREVRSRSRPEGQPITVAGEAGYFYGDGSGTYTAVLPGPTVDGRSPKVHVLELGETGMLISGSAENAAEFRERLESIVSVDVDTWLAAMPRSVVQPQDQDAETAEILRGVPLPPDFDRSTIEGSGMPEDRYQLQAFVLYGAYCAWLDRWWFAQKAGDDEVAGEAIVQLLDAENWPAVQAQASTGALDQDFRMYAKTVASGDGDKQVYDQMMNCIAY